MDNNSDVRDSVLVEEEFFASQRGDQPESTEEPSQPAEDTLYEVLDRCKDCHSTNCIVFKQ